MDFHVAQRRGRQRHHEIVRFHLLRQPRRIRHADDDTIECVRDGVNAMAQQQPRRRRVQQRIDEPIVAAVNAEQFRLRGRTAVRNLFDNRQHRDFVRVGEKEPAERHCHRTHAGRRVCAPQPLAERHRRHFADCIGRRVAGGGLVPAHRGRETVGELATRSGRARGEEWVDARARAR